MSEPAKMDRIEDVAPGDVVYLDRGAGERAYRVVHQDARETSTETTYLITLEADDGDLFDVELPAGTAIRRELESKWESAQSPTPHDAP